MEKSTTPLAALSEATAYAAQPLRQIVVGRDDDGTIRVATHPGAPANLPCDLLRTAEAPALQLTPGCIVLVLAPLVEGGRGVVLGKITAADARTSAAIPDAPTDGVPDELVLEAGHSLTLKVGEGSITIREDGKILIKGTHLVSHAKKMNRIRGGSVTIN